MARCGLGTAAVALGAGLALAMSLPGPAGAASAGMAPSSGKTVKAIVKDVGISTKARCVVGHQARSDKSWGAYSLTTGAGCNPADGYTVVHRTGGGWKALPIGGSSVPCSYLKSQLSSAGASKGVFRDFKAGGYCIKGD